MSDAGRPPRLPALTPPGPPAGEDRVDLAGRGRSGRDAPTATGLVPPARDRLTFRPGVITLRPQSAPDLLDAAVRTLRRRPALYVGVGALLVAAVSVLRAAVDAGVGVTLVSADGTAGLRVTPSVALTPVLAAFLTGVLAIPTAQAVLGRAPRRRLLWAQLRPRLPALLVYLALVTAACLVPSLLLWAALGGRSAQQLDLLLALGALVLLGELIQLPFVAAPAVVTLEGAGPVVALRRSWRLVRGSLGRTLGVLLLGRLLVWLVTAALTAPMIVGVLALETATGLEITDSLLGPALWVLFRLGTDCLTLPFEATLRTLYYVDLRVRREGLDMVLIDAARRRDEP